MTGEGEPVLLFDDLRHPKRDGKGQEVADEEENRAGGMHGASLARSRAVSTGGHEVASGS